jgi:pyruvate dehydrogenase E2 component (dihydrolipoamide acetyltransferase)
MATAVIMPKVDMVMETGTFIEWLKEEADRIEKGEPLFVIMTDKASIEIEAPASGILAGVTAKPDDVIPVTEVIAHILEPGEELPAEAARTAPGSPTPEVVRIEEAAPALEPVQAGQAEAQTPSAGDSRIRATPVARRMASELGIDLAQVKGRGPRGRIHKADILAFAKDEVGVPVAVGADSVPAGPTTAVPLPTARRKEVVPLTGPRKIIAERMAHSAFTAPHITLTLSVDMSEAARLRSGLLAFIEKRSGERLSFTAILLRAVASALPRHPYLNASLDGDQIVLWEDVHVGVATSIPTSSEDYLIVPVIREAQSKGLEQIAADLGDLVERARARRLAPSEMTGSTFTISNLGMFGIESFTAIVNPPESAILAVGKIVDTLVEVEGQIELRPRMHLTLSADHRVVDGAAGARFLADLKAVLENPYLLI